MQISTAPYCNTRWSKIFPFLRWWPSVNRHTLRADLLAGLTGAVIVLPQGVAFALIAGLPPVYGLYTAMVPPIIAALPPLSMPDLHLISIKQLGSAALAIAMLALVEAVAIARSVAAKSGQRIDGNQEFTGQGLSNVVGSFFSSYASSGSFTRSRLNYTAGAVTPLSAVFAAVMLALIVLLIAPLAAYLPIPAMAALLLIVAWRLIDFHHVKTILTTSKRETAVLLTTFFATLFVELEFAIYVGVMLSLVIYLMRTSRPGIVARVPDPGAANRHLVTDTKLPDCPQLKIIRIDGSLFFGAIDHVQETLHRLQVETPGQKHLFIIGNGINFIDIVGAEMIAQKARQRRDAGGGLYLVKVKEEVCSILRRGGFADKFGREHIYTTKADAIAGIVKQLDMDICARCERRIFLECRQLPHLSPARN